MGDTLNKHQIERALYEDKKDIASGLLKEDNPLDTSPEFYRFCEACRRGDTKVAQELIVQGVNINARDEYDYTPLILASLCGHYEVTEMLLEQGALCERDTFQGERCLYNALNDRIRNLLLSYDYSKSTDPLQPLAAHITSLLTRETPKTSDIIVYAGESTFALHKFVLSARSPYFAKKLSAAPETTTWRLSSSVHPKSFETAIRYLYLGDVGADSLQYGTDEQEILTGIDKISRQLEIPQLWQNILSSGDRRLARQKRTEEIERGRDQIAAWFADNVLKYRVPVATEQASKVQWERSNGIFADVLLQADEDYIDETDQQDSTNADADTFTSASITNGIPIGPFAASSRPDSPSSPRQKPRRSVLYPCHRSMLLRSEVFATMFASAFREGQASAHLQIIPVDCAPDVLEIILTFLYTERADFPLPIALDVLTAADMLFIEKLKQRAALLISTLGNGGATVVDPDNPRGSGTAAAAEDGIDIYDVVRAGWDTRVHRLETFGARFLAYRLERFIDEPEFAELVRDSAARIKARQETDTVELIDDIRYYLDHRFRLRFDDAGLDEMMAQQSEAATVQQGEDGEVEDGERGEDQDEELRAALAESSLEEKGRQSGSAAAAAAAGTKNGPADVVRTLDGEIAGDEFAQDLKNYDILMARIEDLLASLGLDA